MALTNQEKAQKKVSEEVVSLTPSTLITLFEFDISDILFENDIAATKARRIFRFHNNLHLIRKNIFWQGKEYNAAPIQGSDFRTRSKGTLPKPKIAMTTNEQNIRTLSSLKQQIRNLDDLVGAKVTRIRTFAKYIDSKNFDGEFPPVGFDPNPDVELPREVFFIDRKTGESKDSIEFQLSTLTDVEDVRLPKRLVLNSQCPFTYRGKGCHYEFDDSTSFKMRREEDIHGDAILPESAPPVATDNDNEIIGDILSSDTQLIDKGQWQPSTSYKKGQYVYILKDKIKYYFVAKKSVPKDKAPPNEQFWITDQCSKSLRGCRLRYGNKKIGSQPKGTLPGGFFPSTRKVGQS